VPDLSLSTPLFAVVLALAAAVLWGMSDFGGGVLGRRGPVIGVLITTQSVGLAIAVVMSVAYPEPPLVGTDLLLSLATAVLASIGVGAFYRGLAVGRMGVVAPVAAVLTAGTPALIGIVLQGAPPMTVIVGFGLAIVAVVVVSTVSGEADARPSGLRLALIGGVALGLMSTLLSRIGLAHVFGPLAVLRAGAVLIFLAVVAARRIPWRLPRATIPLAVAVGAIDLIGNVAFMTASRTGALAIAAILSSLYPIVTVLLATSILHERITRSHAAGVALAGIAIALIAGGTPG
jgi:drug/metabolite transporter (DMT)-like permease